MENTAELTNNDVQELVENTGFPEGEIKNALNIKSEKEENLLEEISNASNLSEIKEIAINKAEYGTQCYQAIFEKWLNVLKDDDPDPFWWTIEELDVLRRWSPDNSEFERKVQDELNKKCLLQLKNVSNIEECIILYHHTTYGSKARKKVILKAYELLNKYTEFNC